MGCGASSSESKDGEEASAVEHNAKRKSQNSSEEMTNLEDLGRATAGKRRSENRITSSSGSNNKNSRFPELTVSPSDTTMATSPTTTTMTSPQISTTASHQLLGGLGRSSSGGRRGGIRNKHNNNSSNNSMISRARGGTANVMSSSRDFGESGLLPPLRRISNDNDGSRSNTVFLPPAANEGNNSSTPTATTAAGAASNTTPNIISLTGMSPALLSNTSRKTSFGTNASTDHHLGAGGMNYSFTTSNSSTTTDYHQFANSHNGIAPFLLSGGQPGRRSHNSSTLGGGGGGGGGDLFDVGQRKIDRSTSQTSLGARSNMMNSSSNSHRLLGDGRVSLSKNASSLSFQSFGGMEPITEASPSSFWDEVRNEEEDTHQREYWSPIFDQDEDSVDSGDKTDDDERGNTLGGGRNRVSCKRKGVLRGESFKSQGHPEEDVFEDLDKTYAQDVKAAIFALGSAGGGGGGALSGGDSSFNSSSAVSDLSSMHGGGGVGNESFSSAMPFPGELAPPPGSDHPDPTIPYQLAGNAALNTSGGSGSTTTAGRGDVGAGDESSVKAVSKGQKVSGNSSPEVDRLKSQHLTPTAAPTAPAATLTSSPALTILTPMKPPPPLTRGGGEGYSSTREADSNPLSAGRSRSEERARGAVHHHHHHQNSCSNENSTISTLSTTLVTNSSSQREDEGDTSLLLSHGSNPLASPPPAKEGNSFPTGTGEFERRDYAVEASGTPKSLGEIQLMNDSTSVGKGKGSSSVHSIGFGLLESAALASSTTSASPPSLTTHNVSELATAPSSSATGSSLHPKPPPVEAEGAGGRGASPSSSPRALALSQQQVSRSNNTASQQPPLQALQLPTLPKPNSFSNNPLSTFTPVSTSTGNSNNNNPLNTEEEEEGSSNTNHHRQNDNSKNDVAAAGGVWNRSASNNSSITSLTHLPVTVAGDSLSSGADVGVPLHHRGGKSTTSVSSSVVSAPMSGLGGGVGGGANNNTSLEQHHHHHHASSTSPSTTIAAGGAGLKGSSTSSKFKRQSLFLSAAGGRNALHKLSPLFLPGLVIGCLPLEKLCPSQFLVQKDWVEGEGGDAGDDAIGGGGGAGQTTNILNIRGEKEDHHSSNLRLSIQSLQQQSSFSESAQAQANSLSSNTGNPFVPPGVGGGAGQQLQGMPSMTFPSECREAATRAAAEEEVVETSSVSEIPHRDHHNKQQEVEEELRALGERKLPVVAHWEDFSEFRNGGSGGGGGNTISNSSSQQQRLNLTHHFGRLAAAQSQGCFEDDAGELCCLSWSERSHHLLRIRDELRRAVAYDSGGKPSSISQKKANSSSLGQQQQEAADKKKLLEFPLGALLPWPVTRLVSNRDPKIMKKKQQKQGQLSRRSSGGSSSVRSVGIGGAGNFEEDSAGGGDSDFGSSMVATGMEKQGSVSFGGLPDITSSPPAKSISLSESSKKKKKKRKDKSVSQSLSLSSIPSPGVGGSGKPTATNAAFKRLSSGGSNTTPETKPLGASRSPRPTSPQTSALGRSPRVGHSGTGGGNAPFSLEKGGTSCSPQAASALNGSSSSSKTATGGGGGQTTTTTTKSVLKNADSKRHMEMCYKPLIAIRDYYCPNPSEKSEDQKLRVKVTKDRTQKLINEDLLRLLEFGRFDELAEKAAQAQKPLKMAGRQKLISVFLSIEIFATDLNFLQMLDGGSPKAEAFVAFLEDGYSNLISPHGRDELAEALLTMFDEERAAAKEEEQQHMGQEKPEKEGEDENGESASDLQQLRSLARLDHPVVAAFNRKQSESSRDSISPTAATAASPSNLLSFIEDFWLTKLRYSLYTAKVLLSSS